MCFTWWMKGTGQSLCFIHNFISWAYINRYTGSSGLLHSLSSSASISGIQFRKQGRGKLLEKRNSICLLQISPLMPLISQEQLLIQLQNTIRYLQQEGSALIECPAVICSLKRQSIKFHDQLSWNSNFMEWHKELDLLFQWELGQTITDLESII